MKAALLMIALAGCTSLRGKADAAYANGNYMAAAGMYDQIGDAQRRDQARMAELRAEVFQVQRLRAAGQDATAKLAVLLNERDDWHLDSPAGLDVEVSAAAAQVASAIATATTNAGPLAGEDAESHRAALLRHADFASTRQAIHTQIEEAGQARCAQLTQIADTPYWQALTARYCGHFDVARDVPTLPDHQRALVLDGAVAGASTAETGSIRDALVAAFEDSFWYAPTGATTRHAKISGKLAVNFSSREVVLTADWTESVPYTDYETSQESYQEPYDDTETYTDNDGNLQTRTVTKYRTAWRDVTTPVTKYRDEPRSQDYPAVERSGEYDGSASVTFAGDLVASIESSTKQHGYDIDTTIEEASVSPQRAKLPTKDDFAKKIQLALMQRMVDVLDADYTQQFCSRTTYTLEEAAECTYGSKQSPPAAQTALRVAFGGETPFLTAI